MTTKKGTFWFWADWAADEAVRRLDPDERGVWIDLLALAARGKPTGYVCDEKGRQLSLGEIGRFTNCPDLEKLAKLIDGILDKGAASRDRAGRLFNRRMVRDSNLSARRSKAGRLGADVTNARFKRSPELPQQNSRQTEVGKVNLKPPDSSRNEVSGDARASISALAFAVADEIFRIFKFDPEFIPPAWFGLPMRIQAGLNAGWNRDVILVAARKQASRRVPDTPEYLEKVIIGEHERAARPIINNSGTGHVQAAQHPGGAYGASKDAFREALGELRTFNASEDGGEGSGAVVEFLPPTGRKRA